MQSQLRDWGDVRIFLAVMREGSTLAASRHLGINQTTVARRIDALEHGLGLTLFLRSTRGAEPTDQAMALLAHAEALEQAVHIFEKEAENARSKQSAPIRITAFENNLQGTISQVVAAFCDKYPGTQFEFNFSERSLDLMKGEADIAIRMVPEITDDRLIVRKLGHDYWTYYASRAYAEKNGLPEEMSDDMEAHAVHLLPHVKSKRRNLIRCATSHDILMALQTGQGIGPLPLSVGDNNPDLVRCFDPPPGADLPVWLVTAPETYKRPDIRRFITFAAPRIARKLKETIAACAERPSPA